MSTESDKKFLLHKIKLLVVGDKDINLLETLEYLGFSDITEIKTIQESLEFLEYVFFGFIICTNSVNAAEFITKLRTNNNSISRFSPVLALLDRNISKEQIISIRDSGATEMMVSTFQIIPLREKIISMIENPRNFIISRGYTGPDRRRKKLDVATERRKKREEKNHD